MQSGRSRLTIVATNLYNERIEDAYRSNNRCSCEDSGQQHIGIHLLDLVAPGARQSQ